MTRHPGRDAERHELDAPPWASDCAPEQGLADALIALHRSERAPDSVVQRIAARLDVLPSVSPAPRHAPWRRILDVLRTNLAGASVGLAFALVVALLVTLRQQSADTASTESDRLGDELGAEEVLLTGTAVPGSLQSRMIADADGVVTCEGQFLLSLGALGSPEAQSESIIRVRWTRCDLPDALSAELKRRFSPMIGAPRVPVSVWGRWQGAGEFDGRRMRL